MPQPLGSRVTSFTPRSVVLAQKQPECVMGIGLVAAAWTDVEEKINSVVSSVMGDFNMSEDGNSAGITPNFFVRASMDQAENIRTRLKIADAIMIPVFNGHPLTLKWEELKKKLYKRGRERNIVVHSRWAWSEQAAEGIIQYKSDVDLMLWVKQDFLDVASRIDAMLDEMQIFIFEILKEIRAKRIYLYLQNQKHT